MRLVLSGDLLLGLLDEVPVPCQLCARVVLRRGAGRGCFVVMRWVLGSLLDEALLVLALGVDRGLGLVDLLAAREGEGSDGEGGCEGSDRELLRR
jgi:hypothetical protein